MQAARVDFRTIATCRALARCVVCAGIVRSAQGVLPSLCISAGQGAFFEVDGDGVGCRALAADHALRVGIRKIGGAAIDGEEFAQTHAGKFFIQFVRVADDGIVVNQGEGLMALLQGAYPLKQFVRNGRVREPVEIFDAVVAACVAGKQVDAAREGKKTDRARAICLCVRAIRPGVSCGRCCWW